MMENNLPKGWIETSFEEICDYIQRGKSPMYTDWSEFPVLNQKAIRWNGILSEHLKFIHPAQWSKWDKDRFLKVNDIAWNSTGTGTIGRATFIDEKEVVKAKVVDSHVTIVRANKNVSSKYIFYWIKSSAIQNQIEELNTGSTNQIELSRALVLKTIIPLAPLKEQQRIVVKLDELMEKIDRIHARLDRIPKILKSFRQSILSAAVSGKLTEEWRTKNIHIAKSWAKGSETNENGWLITKANEACIEVASGSTPPNNPFTKTGDIPFLKVYNIVDQKIDFNYKPQFVSRELHETKLRRCKLFPNDVIINIVGPPLGKVALVSDQYPEWNMNQALVLFRPKKFLTSKFLFFILNEGSEIKRLENEYRGSAGQTNISLTQCRNFVFSIPPIAEQEEIIREVEKLFFLADKIETRYNKAKAQLDKLPQSLLAKAFRGELVPQNKNDEPSRVLLERISDEKKNQKKKQSKIKQTKPHGKKYKDIVSYLKSTKRAVTQDEILSNVNLAPNRYLIELNDLLTRAIVIKRKVDSRTVYSLKNENR